MENFAKMND